MKETREEEITFDRFGVESAEKLFDEKTYFMRLDNEDIIYLKYKLDQAEPICEEHFDFVANPLRVIANAQKIPTIEFSPRDEETAKNGYVYNGVIYVSTTEPTQGLNIGGRILCFVPREINELEKLILGNSRTEMTEEEIQKRLLAIKRGYPAQIQREKESEASSRHSAFSEGESSGSWKSKHSWSGY